MARGAGAKARLQRKLQASRTECRQLRERLRDLQAVHGHVCEQLREEQARRTRLEAVLAGLRRTLFGRKSEVREGARDKQGDGTPPKANEAGEAGEAEPGGAAGTDSGQGGAGERGSQEPPKRHRGRQPGSPAPKRTDRSKLPLLQERLDLDEHERRCPRCGKPYVRCGTKDSLLYEIALQAFARRIRRQRRKPACDCPEARPAVAPPAPRLGQGTQLGTSVWSWIIPQVFHHHRPQASVSRDLESLGLRVPPATLAQGLQRLGALFAPLEEAIGARQARAAVAQADETSWPVQYIAGQENAKDRPDSGGKTRQWLWVCCTPDTVRTRVLATRGLDSGLELLGSLGQAGEVILVCDCWSAYQALAKRFPHVTLQLCWVHQRRHWVRVKTGFPELQEWAEGWLERVAELFRLARQRRRAWQPELPVQQQGAEFVEAQQRLAAALKELFDAAAQEVVGLARQWEKLDAGLTRDGTELARVNAKGKALVSLLTHERGLCTFLDDPRVPMDNNLPERTLRGPVISRYLSFGSGGPQGAKTAGLLLGVLETVRLAGLNAYTWVHDWLEACARNRGQPPADLRPWLPWEMSAERQRQLRAPPRWSRPVQTANPRLAETLRDCGPAEVLQPAA